MKGDRKAALCVLCCLPLVALIVVVSVRWVVRRARRRLFASSVPICTKCTAVAAQMYGDGWFPVANSDIEAMSMMAAGSCPSNFTTWDAKEDQCRHFKDHGVLSAEHNPFRYVQGLKKDDPQDLVVMYTKEMIHWRTKHLPSYEETPKWLAMGPREHHYWGRGDGWIDSTEFTRRLRKTLDFLRDNERPNWEQTVGDHGRFLQQVRVSAQGQQK